MLTLVHIIYFLFILNVESLRNNTVSGDIQYRVRGGSDVIHAEYPFVVIITFYTSKNSMVRYCTASMITDEWGITAAHCITNRPTFAWYGNFTEPPEKTKLFTPVAEVISHPSFRTLSHGPHAKDELFIENDIALFRISDKIHLPRYGRLVSVDRASMLGLPVKYIGAGFTAHIYKLKKEVLSDFNRPLQMNEAAITNCDLEVRRKAKYVMCVSSKCSNRFSTAWYGDSGGPLLYDGKIIGVCSYGIDHTLLSQASFTPISPYIDWISHIMFT